jgi:hypothetical protein
MGNIHPIDIASLIELFHRIDFNVADRAFAIMNAGDFWHRGFCSWLL